MVGGNNGEQKTYLRIAADWYWLGMRKKIIEYVLSCTICQRQNTSHLQSTGLLQPLLLIPTTVWSDIFMDFIEALPKSEGFDTVLVTVDRLTKYGHFIKLKHPFTSKSVAKVFISEVVHLHGFPNSIVSDRDKIFMSLFWKEIFRIQGIR